MIFHYKSYTVLVSMKACITINNGKSLNLIYNNRIYEKEIYKQLTYCIGK